jgi:hypothetical protein
LALQVVWRHQLLYVYESNFESEGAMWPVIFSALITGMVIAQTTLVGGECVYSVPACQREIIPN